MTKHQKHIKLIVLENDYFATNEISIVGTKCDVISELVSNISAN